MRVGIGEDGDVGKTRNEIARNGSAVAVMLESEELLLEDGRYNVRRRGVEELGGGRVRN